MSGTVLGNFRMDEPKETSLTQTESPQHSTPAEPIPFSPPSEPSGLFLGPEGVRPGWRLLVYIVLAFVTFFILSYPFYMWQSHLRLRLWSQPISELHFFLSAFLPAFLMAYLEHRPVGDYGLPLRSAFGKLFWIGVIWGMVSLSVLMGVLYAFGVFSPGGIVLNGARALKFGVFYALMFLLVGLLEEFVTRGYTQFTLTDGIGFWPAAILLSVAFGAIHSQNPGETWIGLMAAGVIGLFFCFTLRRTGNLWFAVGFHASWDWGETYFYSVPDSGGVFPGHLLNSSFQGSPWLTGGTVGPEGSVFLFVLIAGLWFGIDRFYPQVQYPRVRAPEMDALKP